MANIKEAQVTAAGNPSSQGDASEVPAATTEPVAKTPVAGSGRGHSGCRDS